MRLPHPLRKLLAYIIYLVVLKEKKNARTPLILNLFITDNCNLKCSHCFYSGHLSKKNPMSLDNIKTLLKSLKNPLVSVVVTGGEPFLRQDLVELCMLLDKFGAHKIIVATNGTLPDIIFQRVTRILSETNLDVAVQISLDGPSDIHDQIRGVKGAYGKAIQTLDRLRGIKNPRLSLSISTTISKANYHCIEQFVGETRKLNIFHGIQFVRSANKHTFNIDRAIVSDFDSSDEVLSENEMEQLQELVKTMDNWGSPLLSRSIELVNEYFVKVLKEQRRFMRCTAGCVDAIIYPNGDVSLCEFTKPFANLHDYQWDFHRLWTGLEAKAMREKTKACVCTHQCNLLNSLRYDRQSIEKLFSK